MNRAKNNIREQKKQAAFQYYPFWEGGCKVANKKKTNAYET